MNNENEHLLNNESQDYMSDIICYLHLKNVDDYEVEVIRNDIMRMFLDAQECGDAIDNVLGSDYKTFCDEILHSTKYKKKRIIICEYVDSFLMSLPILVGISFFSSDSFKRLWGFLFRGGDFNWHWGITTGNIITWLVLFIAMYVILFLVLNTSVSEKKDNKHPRITSFAFGAGGTAFFMLIVYIINVNFNQVIVQVHLMLLVIILILGYIIHKLLDRLA